MGLVIAAWMGASPAEHKHSWSLLVRRLWEIHAKVRSATHWRGSFSKAVRLGSLLRPISRPSLNHSLAQIRKTYSGGGLGE